MAAPQYYKVFRVEFNLSMADPDIPVDPKNPRYHQVIFVMTDANTGSGTKHHVTGDLVKGMYYEGVPFHHPTNSKSMTRPLLPLGYTPASMHPAEWAKKLKSVPAPPAQKAFNMKTHKTQPFRTLKPLTFYEGNEKPKLRKCTEWTLEDAIPALKKAGLIVDKLPPKATVVDFTPAKQ